MRKKINKGLGMAAAISLLISIVFGIIERNTYDPDLIYLNLMFFSIFVLVLSLCALGLYNLFLYVQKDQEKHDAEREEKEQLIKDYEYNQAVASQRLTEPWAVRYELTACPHCGHYKVRIAKRDDKRLSVAFWGIASDKIGKGYICDNCKHMW